MARQDSFDKMSYAELMALRQRIDRLIIEKQERARTELRQEMTDLAKAHGVAIDELFGRAGGRKGSVAIKFRDPKNPDHTWTGRGRMPRWMVAATKAGKKKDDFLI